MLDSSRKFFLSPSCIRSKERTEYALMVLDKYRIPESNVCKEVDTSLINSGDYLIRCFGRTIQVWQIEMIPFGIATRFLQNLTPPDDSSLK